MPKDEFDLEDPFALVGVEMPGATGEDQIKLMARCFAEEFLRIGWDRGRVAALFADPFYRGPHLLYRLRGSVGVEALLTECLRPEAAGGMPRPRP